MLKKLLVLAGCAALVLSLAACGGDDSSADASAGQSAADQSVAGSVSSSADPSQTDVSAPDMSKSDLSQTPEKPDPSTPKLPVEKPVPSVKEEKPKEPPKPQKIDAPRGNLSDLRDTGGSETLAVSGILVSDPWSSGYIFVAQTNSGYGWEFLEPSTALEGQAGLEKGVGVTIVFDRATAFPMASYPASVPFSLNQVEKTFKAGCASYAYSELVANPDLHFCEPITLTTQVISVDADPGRPDVHFTAYAGENTDPVVVEYNRHSTSDPLPTAGETLTIHGFGQLLTGFTGADGQSIQVPLVDAIYMAKG